jgi:hypothetical protein
VVEAPALVEAPVLEGRAQSRQSSGEKGVSVVIRDDRIREVDDAGDQTDWKA